MRSLHITGVDDINTIIKTTILGDYKLISRGEEYVDIMFPHEGRVKVVVKYLVNDYPFRLTLDTNFKHQRLSGEYLINVTNVITLTTVIIL